MSTETLTQALIADAVDLAERGYHVLPMLVQEDGRKRPLIKWGTEASRDPDTITSEAWAEKWDDANYVGIACAPSGIVVVDIDAYYDEESERAVDGEALLEEWEMLLDEHGGDNDQNVELWDPPWTTTVRRGLHVYLRADPDRPIRNSIKDITHCIDIRAAGGQHGGLVVSYAELPPPADLPLVPEWLYELSLRNEREHTTPVSPPESPNYGDGEAGTDYGLKALTGELSAIQESWDRDAGNFNEDLNHAAFAVGQLVGGGELEYGSAYDSVITKLEEIGAPTDQYKTLDSGFAAGYQRPRKRREIVVTPEALTQHAAKWLSSAAIDQLPPPQWLVPGWLELNSLAQIYGDSNVGKSFIGVDIACSISRGRAWPAGEDGGPALKVGYVVAEGVAGMSERRKAWEAVHGTVGDILFYPEALQIMGPDWDIATEFLAEWGASLIVVDTQSRCTEGIDENKPEQMSKVVGRLDKMRRSTGACVLLVHHTAKGGSTARGTNAIRASIETEIYARSSYGRILLRNTKQKNAAPAPDTYFTLEPSGPSVYARMAIEVPADMSEAVQGSNARMLIRQFLTDHPDVPQTTNEIIEATGLSRPYFHKKIKEMEETNEVIKSSVYRNSRNMSAYLWNPPVSGGE